MKLFKTLFILAFVLSLLTITYAQTATQAERFRAAQEAFDNSQFEKTLTLLDAMEKEFGNSPRIESLRALTFRDLNRPRDAYLSLIAYFKLTENMNLSGNSAHQSLVDLRDELKAKLETDLSVKKDNLQSERNANAEKAISEADKRPTQTSSSVSDPLAELEMWNKVKTSTNANDYYLFLMRFPAGGFAKQAKAKMDEIGDPVWNEIKISKDPFVYRDYIAKNPNSPFIVEAKEKMNMLAASIIAWEQIKDSSETEQFVEFLNKYPNSAQSNEAGKKASEFYAGRLKSYYPKQTKRYHTDSTMVTTNIYDISFTNNCTVESYSKSFTNEVTDEGDYDGYLIDLSGVLISTLRIERFEFAYFNYVSISLQFDTNSETVQQLKKYNKSFTKVISPPTIKKIKGGLFYFADTETATRFREDLTKMVKVCQIIGK